MKILEFLFIGATALTPQIHGEPDANHRGPFWRIVQCGSFDEFNAKLAVRVFNATGDLQKSNEAMDLIKKIDACLDEKIVTALDAAKSHDDARNAVKDFFIAKKSYVDGLYPHPGENNGMYSARVAAAQDAANQKFERAKLEWELAKLPTTD